MIKISSNILENGFILFIQNILTAIFSLIIAITAANFLEPSVYGIYKYIIATSAVLTIFSLPGARKALVRSIANNEIWTYKFLFKKTLLYGYVGSILLLILSTYYLLQGNFGFSIAFCVIALLQPLIQSAELYKSYLNGLQKIKPLACYSTLSSILLGTFLIITIIMTQDYLYIIIIFFSSHAIVASLIFLATAPDLKSSTLDKSTSNETLNYAKHLSFMHIFSKVALGLESILIFHHIGAVGLAVYSFANTPVNQIRGQRKVLSTLITPRFTQYSFTAIKGRIALKAIIIFIISCFLVIIYWVSAPYIFELLFPKYVNSVKISQILSLAILSFPGTVYFDALTAHKKTKALYIVNTTSAISSIFLMLIFMPIWGLTGLALATVISRFISMILAVTTFYYRVN